MKRTAFLPVLATVACSTGAPQYTMSDVEFAGDPGSQTPHVVATQDGGALMSWWERLEGRTHALRVSRREHGEWSVPTTVVQGAQFFVNWADFPSITELEDGTWLAHWPQKTSEATYAYHVMLSTSNNGGMTWSEPFRAHGDVSPTEHGFVSALPWDGGGALIWLDGRQTAGGGGHGEAAGYEGQGSMSIRFATLGSDAGLSKDVLIDDRTCECCTTALAATSGGLVAAYRDRSEAEIRDIAIVRFDGSAWSEPKHVGSDNWHYPGCPVNGPQLTSRGDTVAVAWFAAPENDSRVQVAFSSDGGATFSEPVRIDDGDPSGRVDIEYLDDGSVVVLWLEKTDPDAEIRARRVTPDGSMDESWLVAPTSAARGSGFPRMTRVGNELLFAWTLVGADGGVRVKSVAMN